MTMCAHSCLTLCKPIDCSPLGPSVHGIFQARILEQVATSFSRGSSQPRDWIQISCIADSLPSEPQGKPASACAKLLRSSLTACNTMDYSPPGSSVHGILQSRMLEWVGVPFSRGSSRARDETRVSYVSCIGKWVLYHLCHLGCPFAALQIG